jgi:acyl-CoA thioesterase FadM
VNLFFRLLLTIWRARHRGPLGALDTSILDMRVLPIDLDILMHMNNGRYLSIMDLGRIDLMVRSGLWAIARKRGWLPVVATTTIDYRRSLTAFQRYQQTSRLTSWDDRWFYFEHQFIKDGKIAATANMKTMIRSSSGAVPTADVLAAIGHNPT